MQLLHMAKGRREHEKKEYFAATLPSPFLPVYGAIGAYLQMEISASPVYGAPCHLKMNVHNRFGI